MSSLRTRFMALALGVAVWSTAPTVRAAPLSLAEVLDALPGTHPEIEQADRKMDQADGKSLAARGGFDPTLSVRSKWAPVGYYKTGQIDTMVRQATPAWGVGVYAGYRLGWGNFPVYKGDLQTLSGGEIRAGLDVPVWRDGPIDSRRAKIQRARIVQDGARQSRDATQLALERDAAHAYWTWVSAGLSLAVARELLVIAQQREAGLTEQAKAGAIEPIKLVDNRRLVLDRRAKVVAAEQKFRTASLKLSLFLRDQDRRPIRVDEDRIPDALPEPAPLLVPPLQDEIEAALVRRPDVAVLSADRKAASVDVRLARNQRAPAVNVQTFVAKDLGDGPAQLAPAEWGVGLVVEIPLALREARGEHRAAKAALGAVDAKVRGLRDKIEAEVRAAHVALDAAKQTITLAREQLDATAELAEAERTLFREGASDLVVVNLRELAVADAANQEIEALADYQRARADYLTATGRSPRT